MTKKVFPVDALAYEERELRILHRYPSVGRTMEVVECPFCDSQVNTYPWSRAGSGKRCSCGAKLLRVVARKELQPLQRLDADRTVKSGGIRLQVFHTIEQVEQHFGKESETYRAALRCFRGEPPDFPLEPVK